jgi:hypothetical protein
MLTVKRADELRRGDYIWLGGDQGWRAVTSIRHMRAAVRIRWNGGQQDVPPDHTLTVSSVG